MELLLFIVLQSILLSLPSHHEAFYACKYRSDEAYQEVVDGFKICGQPFPKPCSVSNCITLFVTEFAKRGLPYTSSFLTLKDHNLVLK